MPRRKGLGHGHGRGSVVRRGGSQRTLTSISLRATTRGSRTLKYQFKSANSAPTWVANGRGQHQRQEGRQRIHIPAERFDDRRETAVAIGRSRRCISQTSRRGASSQISRQLVTYLQSMTNSPNQEAGESRSRTVSRAPGVFCKALANGPAPRHCGRRCGVARRSQSPAGGLGQPPRWRRRYCRRRRWGLVNGAGWVNRAGGWINGGGGGVAPG